jgi:hypothetical protein
MDTTINSKKPLSLEQILQSYNVFIIFFIAFIVLMVVMVKKNSKGFNKTFGYEIFITGPILLLFSFLIKEIFVFNNNPQESWFATLPISSHPRFMIGILLMMIAVGITAFFMILYVGGIFSDTPPENNTEMILNLVIILLFFIITIVIYKNTKDDDDKLLKQLPKTVKDAFDMRTKYTGILLVFILITTLLYFVNPWGIMTNYGGPIVFFTLFIGMICGILIIAYQKFLSDTGESSQMSEMPSGLAFILKGAYILAAIAISGGLIFGALKMMGVFNQDASKPESWGNVIFNLIVFCSMLGIIYKLANAGGFLDKNPLYRLILNTLLYIPCVLVTIPNFIISLFSGVSKPGAAFTPPKPFEIKMLALGLVLSSGYFLWAFLLKPFLKSRYLKQGGKQFVNQPIPTDILTSVASYQTLSGSDKFDYRYAISFWFYIDAFPPSTNSSYMKVVPILSYGENPTVKYSSETNTMFITVKQNTEGNSDTANIKKEEIEIKSETVNNWKSSQDKISNAIEAVKSMSFSLTGEVDAEGNRIIYKQPNVLLQKWNHVVLNYSGGTLDVFYNGKLVKSAIEVVPYMKYDNLTIGTENGVKGNVANLMYFKMPLDILTIHTLYTSLKDKNPPSISENPEKLIPVENNL